MTDGPKVGLDYQVSFISFHLFIIHRLQSRQQREIYTTVQIVSSNRIGLDSQTNQINIIIPVLYRQFNSVFLRARFVNINFFLFLLGCLFFIRRIIDIWCRRTFTFSRHVLEQGCVYTSELIKRNLVIGRIKYHRMSKTNQIYLLSLGL